MRTILTGIAAALALTSLSIAHADDAVVQIKPAHRYHLAEEDFYNFKNVYQLENGQRVRFSSRMSHFYTQVDNGKRVRIYPVSRTVFVTDSGARFEFRNQGDTVGIANFDQLASPALVMARR